MRRRGLESLLLALVLLPRVTGDADGGARGVLLPKKGADGCQLRVDQGVHRVNEDRPHALLARVVPEYVVNGWDHVAQALP